MEKNLGNIERVGRFILGMWFLFWAISQPFMNGIEWFVVIVALMLILNGIFSRCFLWFLLDIDTRESKTTAVID